MKLPFKIKNWFIPIIAVTFTCGCGGSDVNQEHGDHEMMNDEPGEMMEGEHEEMMEGEIMSDTLNHEMDEEEMMPEEEEL